MRMDILKEILLPGLAALGGILATVASVLGIVRKRKLDTLAEDLAKSRARTRSLSKELMQVYMNVNELLDIEEKLSSQLGMSKKSVRPGHKTDRHIHPKHVSTRIEELRNQLNNQ